MPIRSASFVSLACDTAVVRARGHDPMLRVSRVAARHLRRTGFVVDVARLLEQPT